MPKYTKYIKRAFRYIWSGQPKMVLHPEIVSIAPNALLEGKCALITGGTSGIGLAIAKAYVESGAIVVLTSRSEDRAQDAAKQIAEQTGHRNMVYGIKLDNNEVCDYDRLFQSIKDSFMLEKVDILVNNAGIDGGDISATTEAEYDRVMDVNLKSVFFLSRAFATYLKENNIRGNILNIASSSSLRPARSAYHLSKWGIRALTLGLAKSLAPLGIVVNGLAPGPTATPLLKATKDDIFLENSLIGRYILPEEIASMAVVLVSDIGRAIVGDTIYMTGGAGLLTMDDTKYRF